MEPLWQYIAMAAALIGAAGYLGWHFWRRAFRKKSPCGACGLMKLAEKQGRAPR